jgi:SAM-dependent methyltransferase
MQYAPATHWDQVFRTYRHRGEDLDWGEQWTGAFAPILRTHHVHNILDLGCGTGNDVLRLTQHGYTVVGLDHSREAIQQAATKAASRATFLVADMAAPLPLTDACFDAVMSNVAMHFFDDAQTRALFTEVRRRGVFLFHVNALEDRPLRAKRKPPVREIVPNYILETDGKTMHFFSAAYLRELLTGWGEVHLELIEITARTTGEPFKYVWRGVAHA